jgi:predicted O-linked N-acetylglucosamine transferase (SPINDLY family)
MDYRLTDAIADPPGQTERFYTEQLWRLPQIFFCYMPSASSPPITPLPADRNGFVTFGCQNNFAKISSRTLDAWAKILQRLPDARLLLLGPDDPLAKQRVADALGDAMARTEIIPWASRREYLARYTQIDIALDPIPFNGHTTTCDALWCGVPVVARLGSQYVSRYGSSALLNLGLSELVASSDADYIEIAIKLASDRDLLRALRESLRARMSVSPICNAKEFTRHLEDAYRQMWKIYLAGRAAK